MSADLYSRRLYWDGRRGAIRADGVTVELRTAPRLSPLDRCVEIDFAPEVRVAQIRDSAEAWRDMTVDEISAANRLIDSAASAARAALAIAGATAT